MKPKGFALTKRGTIAVKGKGDMVIIISVISIIIIITFIITIIIIITRPYTSPLYIDHHHHYHHHHWHHHHHGLHCTLLHCTWLACTKMAEGCQPQISIHQHHQHHQHHHHHCHHHHYHHQHHLGKVREKRGNENMRKRLLLRVGGRQIPEISRGQVCLINIKHLKQKNI